MEGKFITALFTIDLLMPIPVKPKKPFKPKAAPVRQPAANPQPTPLRQAVQRWQRAVRFGWDKGGSHGGRK